MIHALTDLVKLIPDAPLRKLTDRALSNVPSKFWRAPASSTGKYHPAESLGEGGLVRHTRKVFFLTRDLLDAEGIEPKNRDYSVALAAALLHDGWKFTTGSPHSHFEHPLYAAVAVGDLLAEYRNIDGAVGQKLLHCIGAHMGRWNKSDRSSQVLPVPSTPLAKIVHLADFIASRKNVTYTEPADNEN